MRQNVQTTCVAPSGQLRGLAPTFLLIVEVYWLLTIVVDGIWISEAEQSGLLECECRLPESELEIWNMGWGDANEYIGSMHSMPSKVVQTP